MAFLKGLNVGALKETLESGIKAAQDGISNIKVDEVLQGAKEMASSSADSIGKTLENITKKSPDQEEKPSYKEFVGLLWCMAYADGDISADEKTTLEQLSISLDENYSSYAEELEREYGSKLEEASKEFGYRSAAKVEAQKLIDSLDLTSADAKLLCWNLLALANSDGLDESEADLIRFIGEKAGVGASVVEELRNYSDAIIETEKAIDQLKQSDRSYSEIEPIVDEFTKREQTLVEAAQSLIADR